MIGFCVDSNAQLPSDLQRRYAVKVVPLTVTVEGDEYLEGVDLDADRFYAQFANALAEGRPVPTVSTAAPGPGQFLSAYEALVSRGATEILSVHLGSAISGTVNSARIAAGMADVPVRVVDTGTASFAISCCFWEGATAIEQGASLEEAALVAESVARRCANVFVVGALELARAGGRLADGVTCSTEAIPILSMVEGRIEPIAQAVTIDEAVDAMASYIRATGRAIRVGVGVADSRGAPISEALVDRLRGGPEILEVVRYRVGPSVGAHTGPGTAGAVSYPTAPDLTVGRK